MRCFSDLSLGIIDHRTWHRRHDNTVVNEAYAKVTIQSGSDNTTEQLESIEKSIHDAIDQKVWICCYRYRYVYCISYKSS